MNKNRVVEIVSETLVKAASTFTEDKVQAYKRAIILETHPQSKWVLEQTLKNAEVAKKNRSTFCDDTGIPHLVLDMGRNQSISTDMLQAIYLGVQEGLRKLPGRPMAIMGDDNARLDQSGGLDTDPGAVLPAPIQIRIVEEDVMMLHIMLQGGGPAIRGKTYRIYHKHNVEVLVDEIVKWATESVGLLGCSPSTLCIGIGRSHYEAAALMEQAQVDGRHDIQSDLEKQITERVNESKIGSLGLRGDVSVLGTFLKVGPQRASGIRVVCMSPNCSIEPRLASVDLSKE